MSPATNKKLSGKVALVTGAARGIGAATARALADEGADVVISYASSAERARALVTELEKGGVRAAAIQVDQTDSSQVERLVQSVVERFGHLDILVNNAGVFVNSRSPEASANPGMLDRQYAVNLAGVVAAIRAAGKVMADGGRIISVGSSVANRAAFLGIADYTATKAAIVGYTKGAARDLAPRKITVNVVQPGPIDTEMNPATSSFAPALSALTAFGRYGRPDEVAAAIVFLASPQASYITGATLDVDGGFSA